MAGNIGIGLDINSLWKVLNELCDVRKKWKLIGLGLGLPPPDLEAMSGDPLECLQYSLSQWLNGIDPPPTWDALIAVLRSRVVGEEKKAQDLEEKYCSIPLTLADTFTLTRIQAKKTATTPLPRAQSGTSDGSETFPTHDQHEVTPASSERSLTADDESVNVRLNTFPARPSLLSSLERTSDAELKSKVKQKDNQFRSLVKRTHQHLSRTIKTQDKAFTDFKVEITYMPASPHGHNILLSPDDRRDIMKATSFDQIFVILNQYWTFVHYELLEYVVQEYGNDDLKMDMKRYAANMEELEDQVGIGRLTTVKLCSPQPNSEVHVSGSQNKLRDASAHPVQQSMAEQCALHPHTVRTLKANTEMYLPLNKVVPADIPTSALFKGRKERGGSEYSLSTISTGYDTLLSENEGSVVGETNSQVAVLTRVLREKKNKMEGFQHKPLDQSISEKPARKGRAVCILGSVAPHANESVVPQSPADLSDDDREMLSGLNLPPDKWDNLNALLAMYGRTDAYDVFSVQVSKPGMELNCYNVLQLIEYLFMTSLNKEGAVIHYYGNGKRDTGDWCFQDSYITFRDIAGLYMKHSRGRVLTLVPDCHSSGHWASECAKFLDEQGVRPCGHSAMEKGILLKVLAACEKGQDTTELCYTTRAMHFKDNGYVYHCVSGKELSSQQKAFSVNSKRIKCGRRKAEGCSIASDATWYTASLMPRRSTTCGVN